MNRNSFSGGEFRTQFIESQSNNLIAKFVGRVSPLVYCAMVYLKLAKLYYGQHARVEIYEFIIYARTGS